MAQELIESFESGIATLTLNRPESRNALTLEMMLALRSALPRLASDPKVRLVVLTGAGGAFCAGGDINGFASNAAWGDVAPMFENKVAGLRAHVEIARWLHEMPKPTLAVISGAAAGAGLALAAACDLRIASDDAKLTTAYTALGLSGDFGGSYFLSHLVGTARAREMYFTGQVIRGKEAVEMGLVNRSVPSVDLENKALAWSDELAKLPTIAIGYMKRNLNLAMRSTLQDLLDVEGPNMIRTFDTQDHQDALQAFYKKEKTTFLGR